MLVNEKTKTVADIWDGTNLRCTFRRTVGERLERLWQEVVQLASTISLSEEEDEMIWQFTSTGIYTSQPLYKVINFRGILPTYVPQCGNYQFFLWLLSKDKKS